MSKMCKVCRKMFHKPNKPKQITCSRSCRSSMIRRDHGMCRTPFYAIWMRVQSVCYKEKDSRYKLYGGRGIQCEWKSFKEFMNDMHFSYNQHLHEHGKLNTTLERIDNDGNYSRSNCRWATRQEQADNRKNGIKITFRGKTMTLNEWSKIVGVSRFNLWQRIYKYGWSIEKALTT